MKRLCGIALIVLPISVFFLLQLLTPLWFDDFLFACFFEGQHLPAQKLVTTFPDIVLSTNHIYQAWHGRWPIDFVNILFQSFHNKLIFDICNTIVYFLFIFLLCFHVTGDRRRIGPSLFLAANILLWLFVPYWGQDFLWMTGSFNYLWPMTLVLFFMAPYRKRLSSQDYRLGPIPSLLWFFIGLLAGWSLENLASALGVFLIGYFLLFHRRGQRPRLFEVTGMIGYLLGFFFLIYGVLHSELDLSISNIAGRFIKVAVTYLLHCGALTALTATVAVEAVLYYKRGEATLLYLFLAAATAAAGVMMVVPGGAAERTYLSSCVFLLIVLLHCLAALRPVIVKRYVMAAALCVSLLFFSSFAVGFESIFQSYVFAAARERYIFDQKQQGVFDLRVKTPVPATSRYNGRYDLPDVMVVDSGRDDPDVRKYVISHDSERAMYYGLKSLTGVDAAMPSSGNFRSFLHKSWQETQQKRGDCSTWEKFLRVVYERW